MSTLWALALPVLQPALVALVTSLALSIPAAAVALIKWAWTKATANDETAKATALQRLAEIGGRAGAQLATVIMSDPAASAAIQAAKDALVATMAANVKETLAKIGGNASGVEQIILGKAAEVLPAQVAAAAQAAAASGGTVPDLAAAAAALSKLTGLLKPAGIPVSAIGAGA
ncbi:hypothetical protein [Roseomonas elaeocarpi]|uniref:Phage tail tape measure protein n=1 Tax=Roseomonas elaeocarpi TaxID=907779 RepID=A0ABV6JVD2_9PROT